MVYRFIFAFSLLCNYALAANQPSIIGLEFEGALHQDKTGPFDRFIQQLQADSQIAFDYDVVVAARAVKLFFDGHRDCLLPGSDYAPYYQSKPVVFSEFITVVAHTAFVRQGPAIESISQLEGKIIGVIRDFDSWDYEARLNLNNATLVRATSVKALLDLLYRGRIDVAIHDQQDFLTLSQRHKFPEPVSSPHSTIWVDNVGIVCHDTADNQQFLLSINPTIRSLSEQQLLRALYKSSISK